MVCACLRWMARPDHTGMIPECKRDSGEAGGLTRPFETKVEESPEIGGAGRFGEVRAVVEFGGGSTGSKLASSWGRDRL